MFVPEDSPILNAIAAALAETTVNPMLSDRIQRGFRDFDEWAGLDVVATGAAPEGAFGVQVEVCRTDLASFARHQDALTEERFGPGGLIVTYSDVEKLLDLLAGLPGSLTATIHAERGDHTAMAAVAGELRMRAGRLICNGWPTGVAVCAAQQHGGPWPASTNARDTSVGEYAIDRWLVPVAFQDWPDELLPPELARANPLDVPRYEE